jgi:hypothetical protein
MADFSKYHTFLEFEFMTCHIVIPVVDAFVYIVLSKAKKQCLMGNYLVPKMYNAIYEMSHKSRML